MTSTILVAAIFVIPSDIKWKDYCGLIYSQRDAKVALTLFLDFEIGSLQSYLVEKLRSVV